MNTRAFARQLLEQDNILIGYEIEGCELDLIDGKECHQFLVRPITDEDFIDLWEHGRKYCSKFAIYLKSEDLFCSRRPDMKNYETDDDEMYGKDIVEGALEIEEEMKPFADYVENEKRGLANRIEWALDNIEYISELDDFRYNIVFMVYDHSK